MHRPKGYTVLAVLLATFSLAGLGNLVASPVDALGLAHSAALPLLIAVYTAAAAIGAWSLWRAQRWAPEAYLVWALTAMGLILYFQLRIAPQMFALLSPQVPVPEASLPGGLVASGGLLAAGYWYLRSRRPINGRRDG